MTQLPEHYYMAKFVDRNGYVNGDAIQHVGNTSQEALNKLRNRINSRYMTEVAIYEVVCVERIWLEPVTAE